MPGRYGSSAVVIELINPADYGTGISAAHLSILNGDTDFEIKNYERRGNGIGLLIVAELIKFSGIKVYAN